jgi:hypothetical protein
MFLFKDDINVILLLSVSFMGKGLSRMTPHSSVLEFLNQSMGARNRVEIGILDWAASVGI